MRSFYISIRIFFVRLQQLFTTPKNKIEGIFFFFKKLEGLEKVE